jgi:hypothetical protein
MTIPVDPTPALPGRWLAIYEPSRVIGRSRHLTLLSSPDSVREIYDFYATELECAGWITTSQLVSDRSATLVARHGPHGATISINHTGTGTAISIGSYGGGRSTLEGRHHIPAAIRERVDGPVSGHAQQAATGVVLLVSRLEAFSGGVLAIAITLLVLDLATGAAARRICSERCSIFGPHI